MHDISLGRVMGGDLSASRSTLSQNDPHEMAPVKTTPRQLSPGESCFRSNRQAQRPDMGFLDLTIVPLAFTGTGTCAYVLAEAQPGIVSCDYNLQAQLKLGLAL